MEKISRTVGKVIKSTTSRTSTIGKKKRKARIERGRVERRRSGHAFVETLASCLREPCGEKATAVREGGREGVENARRQGRHLENPINQVRVGDGGGCAAVVTEGGQGSRAELRGIATTRSGGSG